MAEQKEDVKVIARLSPAAYAQLEKALPSAAVPKDGTAAAYHLGIQYVLSVLRNGFVSDA